MIALQERTREASRSSPNILVMEDEPSVAKGLEMVLTEEGYVVDLAMTGQAALDNFQRKRCDLLVADLRLPDIDGLEVIKRVKELNPETVVIVITGYASIDSVVKSMRLGAYDYLSKPFTEDQIKSIIDNALKEKEVAPARESLPTAESDEDRLIQKREVLNVLNRTAEDNRFWQALMEKGSDALNDYRLSEEAKAAITSADLKWINEQVGELTQKQLKFIYSRLEREAW
jgi:DNA-binding response OmpR family regulator